MTWYVNVNTISIMHYKVRPTAFSKRLYYGYCGCASMTAVSSTFVFIRLTAGFTTLPHFLVLTPTPVSWLMRLVTKKHSMGPAGLGKKSVHQIYKKKKQL